MHQISNSSIQFNCGFPVKLIGRNQIEWSDYLPIQNHFPICKSGTGEVFLAQYTKLDRKVGLKILPSEFAEDKVRMSCFVREAMFASACDSSEDATEKKRGFGLPRVFLFDTNSV
jgi:hypothetical protein